MRGWPGEAQNVASAETIAVNKCGKRQMQGEVVGFLHIAVVYQYSVHVLGPQSTLFCKHKTAVKVWQRSHNPNEGTHHCYAWL